MTPPTLDELRKAATAAELTLINAVEARVRLDVGEKARLGAFKAMENALTDVGTPPPYGDFRAWVKQLRDAFTRHFNP